MLVVYSALVGVGQHVVRLADFGELLLGAALIGMVLPVAWSEERHCRGKGGLGPK